MSIFQVSPGVEIRERDLTNVVPAVSTSIGAIAGGFTWGPVKEIVTVASEKQLVDEFGRPTDLSFKHFMPAAQYLQYSNFLRVVRAEVAGQINATPGDTGLLIRNMDDYENTAFAAGEEFVAKYPGELGNSIAVKVVTSEAAYNSSDFVDPGYRRLFGFAPTTTEFGQAAGIVDDEMHVVVYDSLGRWTGTPGEVLETFVGVSQARDAKKADGTTNFYKNVINRTSKYIWAGSFPSELTHAGLVSTDENIPLESNGRTYETSTDVLSYVLVGGDDAGVEPSLGELKSAYNLFADPETLDISYLIGQESSNDVELANFLIGIAQDRRDTVAFVSPNVSRTVVTNTPVADVLEWANQVTSSSYGVMDSTALYVYDKYNDVFRYIVASGTVAGLCARTDFTDDPWFSPAGLNRGVLRGVTRIAFNPNKTQRDELYSARVNPIVAFPGEGVVLFGDKTALARPSAFDRINVRRLFIILQKAISTAARFQLFEFNDEFTRAQFRNLVEPFLRNVRGRRGLTDFNVVCDATNNTPEIIDTNRFVGDIYIKPNRSINFITLNFIAVRSGVEFSEIAG